MGFFGKLFEKKVCSLCGGEIGLLGNRKLEDGNCCKECAGKLSPWFDDRRHSTVEQIQQQLNAREENRRKLADFRPTKTFGEMYELKVELVNGVPTRFVVARTDNHVEENADLIEFKDVTSFNIDIDEHEEEQKCKNSEGQMVSYNPPRYEHSYDFYVELKMNHPYVDDIRFRLNRDDITMEIVSRNAKVRPFFDPMQYPEYRQFKTISTELEALFQAGMQGTALPGYAPAAVPAEEPVAAPAAAPAAQPAAAPAAPKFCPSCGAANEGGKFCQYCGTKF